MTYERAPQRVANLLDRAALILGLGLERQLRERDAAAPRRRERLRRVSDTCVFEVYAEPCRAGTPSAPTAARGCGRARLRRDTRRSSMTMNASPPRFFRVSRSVAMLSPSSASSVAMRATEPRHVLGDEHDRVVVAGDLDRIAVDLA